jgi:predicted RecB family nuclease
MTPITLDIVEAYSLCPRKACLLLISKPLGVPHEYVHITDEQAAANRKAHSASLAQAADVSPGGIADLKTGAKVVADAKLAANGLHAHCDFLTRVNGSSRLGRFSYEPVKVIGTCRASRPDALGLAYQGLVLGEVQGRQPTSGTLVLLGDRPTKVKLAGKYKEVRRIVEALRAWMSQPVGDAPPVVLNKHCPSCPFRDACLQQAEKEDNLTLLDRMTPKQVRKYHDKGIFTVKQLSHIFKPRRSRKNAKRQVRHSLELQALAIRTGKVHVEHLPELPRSPVELFLDFEGVPDRDNHYLAGLLVCRGGEAEYESFWADDATGEAAMWTALIERLAAFPDSPVYHYGSYEKKAFATLARRHGSGGGFSDRLVNVASSVYGKVYFPVRSNGLKSLGRFLGATWTDPQASGLQSLVWRYRWERTRDERFRQSLLLYNREDCEAVRLLVARLDKIRRNTSQG